MIRCLNVGPCLSQAVIHAGRPIWRDRSPTVPSPRSGRRPSRFLATIDRLFAEAATDKSKFLSAIVLLTDIKRFDQMNEV